MDRHFDRLDDPLARRHWESRNAKLRVGKSRGRQKEKERTRSSAPPER
jgi:hypothetical protein